MRVTQYRKKRKYRRIILIGISLLGIAAVLACVYLLFYTHKIEVTGNTYSGTDEITKEIKSDPLSVNTLYLLWKYKYAQPEMLPYIDSIDCSLKAPWSVKLTVNEKKIIGGMVVNGQYIYFDKEGLVLLVTDQVREGVTMVEGLEVTGAELYKMLPVSDRKVFNNIISVAKALKKYELAPDRIVCSGADINLYIGNVCVQLGTENYEEKIAQIPPVLEKLNGEGGTLHLEHFGQGSETISFVKGDIFASEAPQPETDENQNTEEGETDDSSQDGQFDGEDGSGEDTDSQGVEDDSDSQGEDQNQEEEQ